MLIGVRAGTSVGRMGPCPSLRPIYSTVFESTHLRYPVKVNRKSIVRSFELYSSNPSGVEPQTCYYKARKGDKKNKQKTQNTVFRNSLVRRAIDFTQSDIFEPSLAPILSISPVGLLLGGRW